MRLVVRPKRDFFQFGKPGKPGKLGKPGKPRFFGTLFCFLHLTTFW